MAILGAASLRGVPALGLSKISSFVGAIFIPSFGRSRSDVDVPEPRRAPDSAEMTARPD